MLKLTVRTFPPDWCKYCNVSICTPLKLVPRACHWQYINYVQIYCIKGKWNSERHLYLQEQPPNQLIQLNESKDSFDYLLPSQEHIDHFINIVWLIDFTYPLRRYLVILWNMHLFVMSKTSFRPALQKRN